MSGSQWDHKGPDSLDDASPMAAPRPAPGDPFAHGELPVRPTYDPDEGEGGQSEIWTILKGLVAAAVAILGVAWLFAQLY